MLSTVKERLILFLKYKRIGQNKFAEICGLSGGFVNGIRVSIQPKTISIIQDHFPELNTSWLLTGDGEMLKQTNIVSEPSAPYGKAEPHSPHSRLNIS